MAKDITGEHFGRLTVLGRSPEQNNKYDIMWDCLCDCGKRVQRRWSGLRKGKTTSCGCERNEKAARSLRKPNAFRFDNGLCFCQLHDGSEFFVDSEDYEIIKDYAWSQFKDGTVFTTINKKRIRLSHILLKDLNPKRYVLYKDGDNHNNTRSNLVLSDLPFINNGFLYINNGDVNKRVAKSDVPEYLDNGWVIGFKKRKQQEIDKSNQKRKITCIEKYGVSNVHQDEEIKKSFQDTCMAKYGVDNPAKSEAVKMKTKETNEERWPGNKNYHNKDKGIATLIKNFGSLDAFYAKRYADTDWEHVILKQEETKRKNNSFVHSMPEEKMYQHLCSIYGVDDVVKNYKEKRYPYKCDFYIKSVDLFIELNRHWTHGGHPFDPQNEEDITKIAKWREKAKTSKYYEYAIENWTVRDPAKIKAAKDNNLNYITVY